MAAAAALAALPMAAAASEGHEAPAQSPLAYELPPAGSYALPPIDRVGDHVLLDADGESASLLALGKGQCAVVAFVYLSCIDASGCPLALASLQRADRELARRPELRGRVRLVTVSFDPERDGPEQLRNLRHHMAPKSDWRFFTGRDEAQLRPVLADYGQDAVPLLTLRGERTGVMRHVAKVFLVDAQGAIRNVYSSGFLDSRILLRDVETLLLTE